MVAEVGVPAAVGVYRLGRTIDRAIRPKPTPRESRPMDKVPPPSLSRLRDPLAGAKAQTAEQNQNPRGANFEQGVEPGEPATQPLTPAQKGAEFFRGAAQIAREVLKPLKDHLD